MCTTPFCCRMCMRAAMEPDSGGVVLLSSRSQSLQSGACPSMTVVIMANNSQVASKSMTVTSNYSYSGVRRCFWMGGGLTWDGRDIYTVKPTQSRGLGECSPTKMFEIFNALRSILVQSETESTTFGNNAFVLNNDQYYNSWANICVATEGFL